MVGKAIKKSGQLAIQLSFRDVVNLDPTDQIKSAMQEALRGCNMSRAQVAEDMNRLAVRSGIKAEGRAITETILDKWTARSARAHLIPLRLLPIFCQVTGSLLPLQAMMPPGSEVVSGEDLVCFKWAKVERDRRRLAREARKLAQEAGIQ
jgi:hypothetical protein